VPGLLRDLQMLTDARQALALTEQPLTLTQLADHLLRSVPPSIRHVVRVLLAPIIGDRTLTTAGPLNGDQVKLSPAVLSKSA
jgi:hypothetical protein